MKKEQVLDPIPVVEEEVVGVIPVVAEIADVQKRTRPVRRVTVRKRVEQERVTRAVSLDRDHVTVERIPKNQWADSPEGPRTEGDTLVVPVYAEVMVKRLVLVEEVRITRRHDVSEVPVQLDLRREKVVVEEQNLDEFHGK
jgi:stress response protein YsnF